MIEQHQTSITVSRPFRPAGFPFSTRPSTQYGVVASTQHHAPPRPRCSPTSPLASLARSWACFVVAVVIAVAARRLPDVHYPPTLRSNRPCTPSRPGHGSCEQDGRRSTALLCAARPWASRAMPARPTATGNQCDSSSSSTACPRVTPPAAVAVSILPMLTFVFHQSFGCAPAPPDCYLSSAAKTRVNRRACRPTSPPSSLPSSGFELRPRIHACTPGPLP